MKQKLFCRIVTALLLVLTLAGCSHGLSEPTPTPLPPEPTATPDPHEGMVEVPNGAGNTIWIPVSEVLIPFYAQMDASAIHALNNDAYYDGEDWALKRGVDVSAYQGDIDWQAAADFGIEFAFIRCAWRGYGSGGTMHVDDCFHANIQGALAAGLEVGVYFFSQATSRAEAAEEAEFMLRQLEGYDVTLPVYFDWERQYDELSRTLNTDPETVMDCCEEFCRVVKEAGYTPGVYFNLHEAYNEYDVDRFAGLKVWVADPYIPHPRYYYAHDMWQYSFEGRVPGIESYVDLDVMYVRADPMTPTPETPVEPTAAPQATREESE